MRSKYSTKHLMSVFFCSTGLVCTSQAIGQNEVVQEDPADAPVVQPLDSDNEKPAGTVTTGDTGEIELRVKDLEITKVLQLLSFEQQRNITTSRDVSGKISVDLYNVTFEEALDAVLLPNGYRWIEEGNFILVVTEEDYEKRVEANRPVETKVIRLNYLRATDALEFIKPLISENGSVTATGDVEEGFQADVGGGGSNQYAGQPTLVVRDYEDSIEEIESLLQQLDVQPKQVIIEATILTASLSENNAFGVDFALFSNLNNVNPLAAVGDLVNGTDGVAGASNVGNTAPGTQEGVKLGFVAGDAAVFVRALDSVTDTTLIATPKTTVLDRNKADILVGQKIAYLSTTVTETSETQTVEFLEVGTQLSVRPFVSDDGKVRLELRPSVSDATIRTIGSTTAPDEETVELITNVIVDSGQTIVLGGLFTEDTTIGRNQIPGLGNLKGIGKAFRGQDDTVSRSEVIFLVKATVVDNKVLNDLGDEGMARVDIAAVAEREQLLPWSRSKQTASHLINARKYYDKAQTLSGEEREKMMDKALYCTDLALHMNPSMVDALILKQEITGEQIDVYLESVNNHTFDAVLAEEMQELDLPDMPMEDPLGKAEEQPAGDAQAEAAPEAEGEEEDLASIVARALAESDAEQAAASESEEQATETELSAVEEEMDDAFLDQLIETPAEETEPVAEVTPAENSVPLEVEGESVAEADSEDAEQTIKIFGYSWRSMSTAQLLQLAAEAEQDTEPELEVEVEVEVEPIDAATAEVETDGQFDQNK